MKIALKPEYEAFIQDQLASGRYAALDDLIGEAILLLMQREQHLAELRQKIVVGTEQIRNRQVTDGETVFAQLQAKLDKKLFPLR